MLKKQYRDRPQSIQLPKSDSNFNLLLLSCFFIVVAIGIFHHEMWYDEFEAWTIARDSNSLHELFKNREYVGHPILWYLCLYIINRFTHNPLAMQIFHLFVASGCIYVFLWFSPFNKIQKALFCFGYFPLYEYGIVSRNYSLGVLFVFVFCACFPSRYRNYIPLAIALALLSLTNIYGLIYSAILAGLLIIDAVTELRLVRSLFAKRWNIATSAIIYCFGSISAVVQIIPPKTAEFKGDLLYNVSEQVDLSEDITSNLNNLETYVRKLEKIPTSIWRSYVPIPNFAADKVWGTNWLTDSNIFPDFLSLDLGSLLGTLLSLLLFVLFTIVFIRQRKVLFVYWGTTLLIFTTFLLIRVPLIRHSGHLFILLIVCFWLSHYLPKSNIKLRFVNSSLVNLAQRHKQQFLTIILSLNFIAGISIYALDLNKPFSASKNAADYIEKNQLENLTIVGDEAMWISPLSALLDKKIYYPEISDFGTFTVMTSQSQPRNEDLTEQDIFQQVNKLINDRDRQILLILNEELQEQSSELQITPLSFFENSMVPEEEQYYLYLVSKADN